MIRLYGTTVTLEPDVENLIRAVMRTRGISFREAMNMGIRAGLSDTKPRARAFVQKTFSLGAEQTFSWNKALPTADTIGDEELSRKLTVRN